MQVVEVNSVNVIIIRVGTLRLMEIGATFGW